MKFLCPQPLGDPCSLFLHPQRRFCTRRVMQKQTCMHIIKCEHTTKKPQIYILFTFSLLFHSYFLKIEDLEEKSLFC